MRYFTGATDPQDPSHRERNSPNRGQSSGTSIVVEPPFSVTGDGQPPHQTELPPQSRLDDEVPEDLSPGNLNSPLRLPEPEIPYLPFRNPSATTSAPPTEEEIESTFGGVTKRKGLTGIVQRNSTQLYIVVWSGTRWMTAALTPAP